MKTTVKISTTRSIVIEPRQSGVMVEFTRRDAEGTTNEVYAVLGLDQVGALIFGLEQAAEAAQIAQQRAMA